MTPLFSLCHPSARPPAVWQATRDKWLAAAADRGTVEHICAIDFGTPVPERGPSRIAWNLWSKCCVDATNVAAQCSTGSVLLVIADDFHPMEKWDQLLREVPELWEDRETVVRVATAGIADGSGLITLPILNRKRYEAQGYIYHPAYISMYCDDEFTAVAERDHVVVDARHILCYHDHPTTPGSKAQLDDVYHRQNAPARYKYGAALLRFRQEQGFPRTMPEALMAARLEV